MIQSPYSKTQLRRARAHTAGGFTDRILRVFRFDATVYEEVRHDRNAVTQAMAIVFLSSAIGLIPILSEAANSPVSEYVHPFWFVLALPLPLLGWMCQAVMLYFVGAIVFRGPYTDTNITQVMTVTGFASVPGLFGVVAEFPVAGTLLGGVITVWMSVLQVIAIREVFDYSSMLNALGVWLANMLALIVVMLTVLGIASLAFMLVWR